MADNAAFPITTGKAASREVTYSGETAQMQANVLAYITGGADDAKTVADVTSTTPLPIYMPDLTGTGTITATDAVVAAPAGAGALVSGASTAGSLVSILLAGGDSAWNVQITALTSGTLYFEGSLDSTNGTDGNWINVNGRRTGVVNTELAGNATANGVWRGNTSGLKYFRVRSVGALTGTPAIVIRISDGTGAIFLNASIPAGANNIGKVELTEATVFKGRAATFRTPGRAGTAGQKILSLHNATGSTVAVTIKKIFVDVVGTVVKAVTVLPPVVRVYLVTVLPTNGTALTKNKIGGTGASSASVTVLGDASADGTGSATALTATLPAGAVLTQEFAARLITAAGYEPADRHEFFGDSEVPLGPLQGVVVMLDYVLATQNPTTDMWLAGVEWTEK